MKTVTILLSFLVNEHGVVHKAVYQTNFESCYAAEQAALDRAWKDYVETGKADEVTLESCVDSDPELTE